MIAFLTRVPRKREYNTILCIFECFNEKTAHPLGVDLWEGKGMMGTGSLWSWVLRLVLTSAHGLKQLIGDKIM